jgi:katanin p60 ATPase-containing subunit A1
MPVDLSASIYAEYKRARKRAEEAERKGEMGDAAGAYRQCAELMRRYAQYAIDGVVRQERMKKATAYEQAALRFDGVTGPRAAGGAAGKAQPDQPAGEDDYEAEVLALIQQTHIRWDDIGGLDNTKQTIKSAYGMALARKPKGVEIRSWRNVLLYGPPGTGKTLLAAATAGSLEATFFNVKVSNLLSKYFGESTKLITALYAVARRLSPAVIFLDEFDSLTPPRGSGESGAERRIVSTLLAELDGLATKEDESFILTMGATNVPWLLDTAILSRFQQRIYVPLPDPAARKTILEIHLTRRGHRLGVSLDELVTRTQGFAGREIEQLCQTAIAFMTRRANPDLLSIVDRGQAAVRNYEIRVEPLTQADFAVAFEQIKPVANQEMLDLYSDWVKKVEM